MEPKKLSGCWKVAVTNIWLGPLASPGTGFPRRTSQNPGTRILSIALSRDCVLMFYMGCFGCLDLEFWFLMSFSLIAEPGGVLVGFALYLFFSDRRARWCHQFTHTRCISRYEYYVSFLFCNVLRFTNTMFHFLFCNVFRFMPARPAESQFAGAGSEKSKVEPSRFS